MHTLLGAVQILPNLFSSSSSFFGGRDGGGEPLHGKHLCRVWACKIWGFKVAYIGKTIATSMLHVIH